MGGKGDERQQAQHFLVDGDGDAKGAWWGCKIYIDVLAMARS
tara:strand:+ start:918 stop:1043 length:126 start_codon:yes stop_codon:yes gene_type:complete